MTRAASHSSSLFLEKTVRSSRKTLETHCFVLGGNEFRLRGLLLRRLNIAKKLL